MYSSGRQSAEHRRSIIGMDPSSRGAAMLLMWVRKIAIDEVSSIATIKEELPSYPKLKLVASQDSLFPSASSLDDLDADAFRHDVVLTPQFRHRAVSVCSQDLHLSPSRFSLLEPSSSSNFEAPLPQSQARSSRGPDVDLLQNEDDQVGYMDHLPLTESLFVACEQDDEVHQLGDFTIDQDDVYKAEESSRTFVGITVRGPIKAVLRKKFSWKTYPELETYLIDNRAKYLQFSSQLNYTSEQKRYNNKLTQGLLDLAAKEGYIFEGFTFPAVRDRIRCYYKSFVQAGKKKNKKKRR